MKLFFVAFLIVHASICLAVEKLQPGKWEGYKLMGSTYGEFFLEIDSSYSGYYGFSPDIRNAEPICFAISKDRLLKRQGYFQQDDTLNRLEFSLILVPSVDSTFDVVSILKYPEKNTSFSHTWNLVKVNESNRNMRTVERCKMLLKKR